MVVGAGGSRDRSLVGPGGERRDRVVARGRGRRPVAKLLELLIDAVRLRLRADVPVGTCLSGGIDSSTIVA